MQAFESTIIFIGFEDISCFYRILFFSSFYQLRGVPKSPEAVKMPLFALGKLVTGCVQRIGT